MADFNRSNLPRLDRFTNVHAERVRRVASLSRRGLRERHQQAIVEGPQSVAELISWRPNLVRDVYFSATAQKQHPQLHADATSQLNWVHSASDEVLAAMSPDCQGVLAVIDTADFLRPVADITGSPSGQLESGHEPIDNVAANTPGIDRSLARNSLAILERTQDPGNAGTLIRIADAAGLGGVIFGPGSVEITSPKVLRSTAGSAFHLPLAQCDDVSQLVEQLRQNGFTVFATSAQGEVSVTDIATVLPPPAQAKVAWVLGNEAQGVSVKTMAACNARVSIPIYGLAESLNVAAAGAICFYRTAFYLQGL